MSDSEKPPAEFRPPRLAPGMKPADHPDFFRFPAPPGRSRESKIVLDERGQFWNAGVLVDHAGMARAFASWIARHPDDGRYILTNRYDWTYFTVVDVPYFVRHVRPVEGEAWLDLSDGTEERLDPSGVTLGAGGVLYARVKGRAFEARFSTAAQSAMFEFVDEDADGRPAIASRGELFTIEERSSEEHTAQRPDEG